MVRAEVLGFSRPVARQVARFTNSPLVMRVSLAVGAIVCASIFDWLRLPRGGLDTFYAEDGRTFIGDWVNRPSFSLFFEPYAGYQHLLPRVVSFLVAYLTPIGWWANSIAILSCLVVGSVAYLIWVLSRDVVASTVARFALATLPVILPIARLEAIGDVTNLHWYMVYLMPWILLARPRTTLGKYGLAIVAFIAVMTEPQCVIYLPLAALMFFKQPGCRFTVVGWLAGSLVQGLTDLKFMGIRTADYANFLSGAKGYSINAVATNAVASGSRLGSLVVRFGWWIPAVAVMVFMIAAILTWIYGSGHIRIAVTTVVLASFATWGFSFFLNNHSGFNYELMSTGQLLGMPFVRWGTGAAMLIAAVIPLSAATIIARWPQFRMVGYGCVIGMVAVMSVWFAQGDTTRGGPHWNDGLKVGRTSCETQATTHVEIPSYPAGWAVSVPCKDLQ